MIIQLIFLKDNIYFQLKRYEIKDSFWETIISKININK